MKSPVKTVPVATDSVIIPSVIGNSRISITIILTLSLSIPPSFTSCILFLFFYSLFSPHTHPPPSPHTHPPLPLPLPTSDCSDEVDDLRLAYATLNNELDKTKRLLSLQSTISNDYKKELELVRIEMKELQQECDRKTQLLDAKNNRIKVSKLSVYY